MSDRGFQPPSVANGSRYALMNPERIIDPDQIRERIRAKNFTIPYHNTKEYVKSCGCVQTQDFIRGGYTLAEMYNFGFTWDDLIEIGLSKNDFYDGWFDTKTIARMHNDDAERIHVALHQTLFFNARDLIALYTGGKDFARLGITMERLIMYYGLSVEQFMALDLTLESLCRDLKFSKLEINRLGLNRHHLLALWWTREWTPEALRLYCNFSDRDRETMRRIEALPIGNIFVSF